MNKSIFFLSIVVGIFLSNEAFCQLKVINHSNKCITVSYFNDSTHSAYFIDPSFYLLKKVKKNKIEYHLRSDMFLISMDTLYLIFTDTTLKPFNDQYRPRDSVYKSMGFSLIDSLKKSYNKIIKITFLKEIEYKYLVIKYNFTYKKEEFYGLNGIPAREILVK